MLIANSIGDIAYLSSDAAHFVRTHDLAALPCGRYDLSEEEFVNVMEYETRPREGAQYEAHRKYIDIQMVIAGAEYMEVAPIETFADQPEFDVENDFVLLNGEIEGGQCYMTPGMFVVVTPNDAHMPSLSASEEPSHNKKAVFKILSK